MKNRSLFLCVFFLILSNIINAQTIITGTVLDKSDEAVMFANIVVLKNSKIITGTITDIKGEFKIETQETGDFDIQISFVGFNTFSKAINSNTNLGIITLLRNSQLQEIVVNGDKKIIEQKVDRLVFNVNNSPFLKGKDGVEILKRTPRVISSNGGVSILGKSSTKIMINNRISTLSGSELIAYLQSISTKDIDRVEVIANPSSRYEAEGNTGIINIVLKNNRADFYSGSLAFTYNPATYYAHRLLGSVNLKKDKFLLSVLLSNNKSKRRNTLTSEIDYPNQSWNLDRVYKVKSNDRILRTTLDYSLNDKTSIGVNYRGVLYDDPVNFKSVTNIYNKTNVLDSVIADRNKSNCKNYIHSIGTYMTRKLDTLGKNVMLDIDYYSYKENNDNFNISTIGDNSTSRSNIGVNDIKIYSGKLDFDLPYKHFNIELGIKASLTRNKSEIKNYKLIDKVQSLDENTSNAFVYTEKNQAIYASIYKKLSSKWSTKLGVRLENTQVEGYSESLDEKNNQDYLKLFPSVFLKYIVNEENTLSLNYSKRINRPYFSELNPFRYYTNAYTYIEGNPYLKPSYINSVELSYSHKSIFQASLFYTKLTNAFNQVLILHPNNEKQYKPLNYYSSDKVGMISSLNFDVCKAWNIYTFMKAYYIDARSKIPEVKQKNNGFTGYVGMNNSFILNKKKTLFASLNCWYNFPDISALHDVSDSYEINIGFKALLFKEKLMVSVNGSDLLKSRQTTYTTYNSDNIKTSLTNYFDSRRLSIRLRYRFGSSKVKKSRGRNSSNEDEQNRI